LEVIRKEVNAGARWVVDADFADFFGSLDPDFLLRLVARRVRVGPSICFYPLLKTVNRLAEAGHPSGKRSSRRIRGNETGIYHRVGAYTAPSGVGQ